MESVTLACIPWKPHLLLLLGEMLANPVSKKVKRFPLCKMGAFLCDEEDLSAGLGGAGILVKLGTWLVPGGYSLGVTSFPSFNLHPVR